MKRMLRLFEVNPGASVKGTTLPADTPSDAEVVRWINKALEPAVGPASDRVRWTYPVEGCPPMRPGKGSWNS